MNQIGDTIKLENEDVQEENSLSKRGRKKKYFSKEDADDAYRKQQKDAQQRYAQQRKTFAHNAIPQQKQLIKFLQTHFIQDPNLVNEVIKIIEKNCL